MAACTWVRVPGAVLAFGLGAAACAGELVNDTKETVAVQVGTRDAKTGGFTWSEAVELKHGEAATIPDGHWFRHDTHVRDGKVTFGLPAKVGAASGRDYLSLAGTRVGVDITRK